VVSVEADVEAIVAAFVEDLADLVRRVARTTVQNALADSPAPARAVRAKTGATPARPSRRVEIAPSRTGAVALPSSAAEIPRIVPPVAVQRIPPKRRRGEGRGAVVAKTPTRPHAEAEPIPARAWVVVRRPARDRRGAEGASEVPPSGPSSSSPSSEQESPHQ
jgi:hypothetical protein